MRTSMLTRTIIPRCLLVEAGFEIGTGLKSRIFGLFYGGAGGMPTLTGIEVYRCQGLRPSQVVLDSFTSSANRLPYSALH